MDWIERQCYGILQQHGGDGGVVRRFGLRGADLGGGDDRVVDRVVMAAEVDRIGLPRPPI